eukprot:gene31770-biopygen20430
MDGYLAGMMDRLKAGLSDYTLARKMADGSAVWLAVAKAYALAELKDTETAVLRAFLKDTNMVGLKELQMDWMRVLDPWMGENMVVQKDALTAALMDMLKVGSTGQPMAV